MKFKWREKLGKPECPYVERWVADFGLFSIRIHKWLASDDNRALHDHPWDYYTMVLKGNYYDIGETPYDSYSLWSGFPWKLHFRKAERRHWVKLGDEVPTWTILFTGPEKREWGFWVNGKFRKRNKYFFENGHHPCE
jgi:hypothetical protein